MPDGEDVWAEMNDEEEDKPRNESSSMEVNDHGRRHLLRLGAILWVCWCVNAPLSDRVVLS